MSYNNGIDLNFSSNNESDVVSIKRSYSFADLEVMP
jgi:hypothetical protein